MPNQKVELTFPWDPDEVDLGAARLQAARVVNGAAANSHGVSVLSVNGSSSIPGSTLIAFNVHT